MPFSEDLEERKERAFRLYEAFLADDAIRPDSKDATERMERAAECACHCELIFDREWHESMSRQGFAL